MVGGVALGFEGELDRDRVGGGAEEIVADGVASAVAPGASDVDHRAGGISDRTSGFSGDTGLLLRPTRGARVGDGCVTSVLILGRADAIYATAIPHFLRSRR